jgi:hypothetical protein
MTRSVIGNETRSGVLQGLATSLFRSPLLRYPIPPIHLVCVWISPSAFFSLHRHPDSYIPSISHFIRYNKFKVCYSWIIFPLSLCHSVSLSVPPRPWISMTTPLCSLSLTSLFRFLTSSLLSLFP